MRRTGTAMGQSLLITTIRVESSRASRAAASGSATWLWQYWCTCHGPPTLHRSPSHRCVLDRILSMRMDVDTGGCVLLLCSRTALWSNYVLLEPVPHLLNCCLPIPLFVQGITIQHVWYYGWITALSTGLGTLPFLIVSEMNQWWLGVSNGTSSCLAWPHCPFAPGHYSLGEGRGRPGPLNQTQLNAMLESSPSIHD